MMVLNKYLAHAGICSRRKAAELIKEGRVKINGAVITVPSYQVKERDCVKIGSRVIKSESKVYVVLNKPRNCLTTVTDDRGRRTVCDLLGSSFKQRLYPVGRLDRDTTGILLLTNDGQLAQDLAHPKNKIKKVYRVTLSEPLKTEDMGAIRKGVRLEDGIASVDTLNFVSGRNKAILTIELHSGKNRIIRRIFEHFGYEVKKLDRLYYAGITKQGTPVSQWRVLTAAELQMLRGR